MTAFSTLLAAAVLATNAPATPKAVIDGATGFAVGVPESTDPTEIAYQRLLARDDEAQTEMDRWIREADEAGASADNAALQKRIDGRIAEVEKAYREFLERHPDHVRARIAYGSFLGDTGQEPAAREQWEKALQLDPRNPAIYNNLAGIYGHRGPVTNAFAYYEKAIELAPNEPVYYQNLATTVYLYRRDVMEYYGITDEQKVFDKALGLYRKAQELDPDNFILATDLAQSYYGIKPPRHEEALKAWQRAFRLASDDLERQGIRVHLARVQVQAGRFDEARAQLDSVTNAQFAVVRDRIRKTLESKERERDRGAAAGATAASASSEAPLGKGGRTDGDIPERTPPKQP